jgi:hypothetical protein
MEARQFRDGTLKTEKATAMRVRGRRFQFERSSKVESDDGAASGDRVEPGMKRG